MPSVIGAVLLLYGGVVGAMFLAQRRLMYFPDTARPTPAAAGVPEMEAVEARSADGLALECWYCAPADERAPVLVFFHGNAGHIGDRGAKARLYLDAGLGVLLVGYRGFGGNPGRPTEAGLAADGRAALAFLAAHGVGPARTVLYGESLGTGVAVRMAAEMATEEAAAAVVLEAPFTSAAAVAQHHYFYLPARWLVRDRYDSLSRIGAIGAPLLVLHGERDRTVPARFGRRLLAAAREPKEGAFFAAAGHNDLYECGAGRAVLDFLRRRAAGPRP